MSKNILDASYKLAVIAILLVMLFYIVRIERNTYYTGEATGYSAQMIIDANQGNKSE